MTIDIAATINSEPPRGKYPDQGEKPPPLDGGLLNQIILEMNIARKNFVIYPLGHSQIAVSIVKVYGLLIRLM